MADHARRRFLTRRLHDYFFPHRGNGYKPHLFRTASVATIAAVVILLEGAYLAQVDIVFPHTNFLASVLPGTLIALTNTDRAANNVGTLAENQQLDQAATLAAEDMATKGYFAHVSPTGVTPWQWLDQVGYKYTYAGENLAVNFTDSTAVESAWMASPTHHANIVKPQYTEIGIGVANGMYEGKQATFVVQFFGTPEVLLPVAAPAPAQAAAKPKPVPKPIAATSTPSTASTSAPRATTTLALAAAPTVLGAEVAANPSWLERVAASPTHAVLIVLELLATILAMLFAIAVFVKVRVQYLEVIGSGLFILIILIGLIIYDSESAARVELPANTADSAVVS